MIISLAEIQRLSVSERLALIEALWDSIAAASDPLDLTDAQRQELTRRFDRDAHNRSGLPSIDGLDAQPGHYAVTMFKHRSKAEEEQLVEEYIGLDNERYG